MPDLGPTGYSNVMLLGLGLLSFISASHAAFPASARR
jgi:hypothetical protein